MQKLFRYEAQTSQEGARNKEDAFLLLWRILDNQAGAQRLVEAIDAEARHRAQSTVLGTSYYFDRQVEAAKDMAGKGVGAACIIANLGSVRI